MRNTSLIFIFKMHPIKQIRIHEVYKQFFKAKLSLFLCPDKIRKSLHFVDIFISPMTLSKLEMVSLLRTRNLVFQVHL